MSRRRARGTAARRIVDEVFVAQHPVLRTQTLFVLPAIPEDAPHAIREGVARRRIVAVTGECPCGATADYGHRRPGEVGIAEVWHQRSCPADTDRLDEACRRWAR